MSPTYAEQVLAINVKRNARLRAQAEALHKSRKLIEWPTSRAFDVTEKPHMDHTPIVAWEAVETTALTTPAVYAPSVCNTGTQATGWDGQDDPVFQFFPGSFKTQLGTNNDVALVGEDVPGGADMWAGWPVVITFDTTATTTIEIQMHAALTSMGLMVEVNGRLLEDTVIRPPSDFPSWGAVRATLTFPVAMPRTIRLWMGRDPGLREIRVPTGVTLSKPATTGTTIGVIGDSFAGGSGTSWSYPDQGTGMMETFAPRLLRMMGADRMILCSVGGQGWSTANPFSVRAPVVAGFAPDSIVFFGSVNDHGRPLEDVKAGVTECLALTSAVPKVYVIPPGVPDTEPQAEVMREAALAAGATFVDWGLFFTGTGNVTNPQGDGNRDFYRMADNAHPTLDAHRAMARTLYSHIVHAD